MSSKKPNPKQGEGDLDARLKHEGSDTVFVSEGKGDDQSASQRNQRKLRASQVADLTGRPTGTQVMPSPSETSVRTFVGDKYEIRTCLGQGGMSVVYKAWDHLLKRNVAIKVLSRKRSMSGKAIDRFVQEAQATSQLDHPNLIKVYEFANPKNGEPYLVMDYLEGWSLNDTLPDDGMEDINRAVKIIAQVLSGLKHAHRKGVIHRDLKPSNIMLVTGDDGQDLVKIVDFGIAKIQQPDSSGKKLTETGEVFGSPLYMSPEQCRGEKLDARSDIYSCACVMYEIFVGTPPFMGANFMDTLHLHMHEEAEPLARLRPDLPDASRFDAVLKKALAKEPEKRYQTIDEMAEEFYKIPTVQKVLNEHAPDSVPNSLRRRQLALAALALLLLFAGKEFFDIYMGNNPDNWAAKWLSSLGTDQKPPAQYQSFLEWSHMDSSAQRAFDLGRYERAKSRFEQAIAMAELPNANAMSLRTSREEYLDLKYVLGVLEGKSSYKRMWQEEQSGLSREPPLAPEAPPQKSKQDELTARISAKALAEALDLNRQAMHSPDAKQKEELFERARNAVIEMTRTGVPGASRVLSEQTRYLLCREGIQKARQVIDSSLNSFPAGNPVFAADQAIMYLSLARLEADIGNAKGARAALEKASALSFGESRDDIAAKDLVRGWLELLNGNLDSANRNLTSALVHVEAVAPRNYDLTALSLELLGNCNLGRLHARIEHGLSSQGDAESEMAGSDDDLPVNLDLNDRAVAYYKRAIALRMRATRFDSSAILTDFDAVDDICARNIYEPFILTGIAYIKELEALPDPYPQKSKAPSQLSVQPILQAYWLNNLSDIYIKRHDYKSAEKHLKDALRLIDMNGIHDKRLEVSVVDALRQVYEASKNSKEADVLTARLKALTK